MHDRARTGRLWALGGVLLVAGSAAGCITGTVSGTGPQGGTAGNASGGSSVGGSGALGGSGGSSATGGSGGSGGSGGTAGSGGSGAIGGSGGSGGTSGGSGGTAGSGGSGGSGGSPPTNRYGMGYVNEGSAQDHDLTAALTGPGGTVLVIFADIRPGRTTAEASWKQSITDAYARDLVPVIRMAPPWGDRYVRDMGESPTSYQALAGVYRDVILDLPLRSGWPIYVQVHNEPNLCYEWQCHSGTLTAQQIATEYAHMLSDVADELHAMGDPRIQVLNGPLAPGGNASCDCATSDGPPGTLATEFLGYMMSAVPGLFDKVDVFASHSYPALGLGWGFFCPYGEAEPGLLFFENELSTIGKPSMAVLITETGWTIEHESYHHSREQVADWTVMAYENIWLTHPNILGVTPFMLRDSYWDNFAWTHTDGTPYPVYTDVRAFRCLDPTAQNCP